MLDLSGNLMSRLPDCVKNLSNSTHLMLYMDHCPQLRSVIHPPSCVKYLTLQGNRQLKRTKVRPNSGYIKFEMDENTEYVEIEGCLKWVPACSADKKVIKNLGLESVPIGCVGKVQYERGIFSTFVKSKKVPSCFKTYFPYGEEESEDGGEESEDVSYKKMGISKVTYTIPSSVGNKKIQGLNICFAIRLELNLDIFGYIDIYVTVTVGNKTKDLAWCYKILDRFEEVEKQREAGATFTSFLWVSTWKCEDLLEAGDEIELSFHILPLGGSGGTDVSPVEKCGIRTVYEEGLEEENEEVINDNTLLWTYQINDSFSNYRTRATTYYLEGRIFYVKENAGSFHRDPSNKRNHSFLPLLCHYRYLYNRYPDVSHSFQFPQFMANTTRDGVTHGEYNKSGRYPRT